MSYDSYIEECVKNCSCDHKPCDGVMAGGFCDQISDQDDSDPEEYLNYEEFEEDFAP